MSAGGYAVLALLIVLMLVCFWLLIVGQPAAIEQNRQIAAAQQTRIAYLEAHQLPTATPYPHYCLYYQFC